MGFVPDLKGNTMVALVSQNGEWFAGNRGEKVVVGVYFAGKT
jgi:hypothetical protein